MKTCKLTSKEQAILALLRAAEGPTSARKIYEQVWKEKYLPTADNTVAVHISRLRRKMGGQVQIRTLWGIGYQLKEE